MDYPVNFFKPEVNNIPKEAMEAFDNCNNQVPNGLQAEERIAQSLLGIAKAPNFTRYYITYLARDSLFLGAFEAYTQGAYALVYRRKIVSLFELPEEQI